MVTALLEASAAALKSSFAVCSIAALPASSSVFDLTAALKRSTPRPFKATALLVRIAGWSPAAAKPSSYEATAAVYFATASSELLLLAAALAGPNASLPALKVREMISFASVIFLLPASISAFFFIISSRLALSAALSPPPEFAPPAAAAGGLAEPLPAALISSIVSRLPSPGVTVISQGMSRPAFTPGTQFGFAVG